MIKTLKFFKMNKDIPTPLKLTALWRISYPLSFMSKSSNI